MLKIIRFQMKTPNTLYIIILCFSLMACGSNQEQKKKLFSLITDNNQTKFNLGETLKASIKKREETQIDSVTFLLDDRKISTNKNGVF